MTPFKNRRAAGTTLGDLLQSRYPSINALVLGLPRGGVPVGYEVAKRLEAPFDVLVVRKLGAPGHRELAIGAIAPDGVRVLNHPIILSLHISEAEIAEIERDEAQELQRREERFRRNFASLDVRGRTVVLVDDGIATGATMQAAIKWALQHHASQVIAAAPVGSKEVCAQFRGPCVECIVVLTRKNIGAVGLWYEDFSQVSDDEVNEILLRATSRHFHSERRS